MLTTYDSCTRTCQFKCHDSTVCCGLLSLYSECIMIVPDRWLDQELYIEKLFVNLIVHTNTSKAKGCCGHRTVTCYVEYVHDDLRRAPQATVGVPSLIDFRCPFLHMSISTNAKVLILTTWTVVESSSWVSTISDTSMFRWPCSGIQHVLTNFCSGLDC